MKKSIFIISSISLTIIALLLLLINISFLSNNKNEGGDNTDKFININRLSNKVLIINFGYDAVTAVKTQRGIIVIDAGISNSLTAKYRKVIEREFNCNKFSYLINTHSHLDHVGGNQVFSDAVIVGQVNCVSEMIEYWKNPEKIKMNLKKIVNEYEKKLLAFDPEWMDSLEINLQIIRYQHAYNDLLTNRVVTPPTLIFKDTLNISIGDIKLNLIYLGKAHSGSDILICVPEVKILMTGDLFSPGGRPDINEISTMKVERWYYVKKWINEQWDKFDKVIGGHGQIMTKNDLNSFIKSVEVKLKEAR